MNPTPQSENSRECSNVIRVKPEPMGQAGKVLNLLRLRPHNSLELSREHGILQYNARIKQLRDAGWNIQTEHLAWIEYCGEWHRGIGLFVLLSPEWPRLDFIDGEVR